MKRNNILACAALVFAARLAFCDTNPTGSVPATSAASSGVTQTWTITTTLSRPIKTSGVPNFGKLNDHIWRSGQPTAAGYRLLASQGLKTVVNLREEFPQDKDLLPEGVQYIYIPIKDEHAPTKEQAQEFMKAASNPANWPLLVHCHAGEGRAGTMAALVRCSLDKWDDRAVMKETNAFISSVMGLFKPQLAGCQRQLIQKWETEAPAAGSNLQLAAISSPASGGSTIGKTIGATVSSSGATSGDVKAGAVRDPATSNGQSAGGAPAGH